MGFSPECSVLPWYIISLGALVSLQGFSCYLQTLVSPRSILSHYHLLLNLRPTYPAAYRIAPFLVLRHFLLQTSSTDLPVLSAVSPIFFSGCWDCRPAGVGEGWSFYFSQLLLISLYRFYLLDGIQVLLKNLCLFSPPSLTSPS